MIKVAAALCLAALALAGPARPDEEEEQPDGGELFEMSIEELMELPVEVSGSLTGASRRLNPSTVTTITREEIVRSGARDLDELLDIMVPNFQRMWDYYEFRKNGLRGINNDRDDKYLILVNGRVMNEHTHYGAISERDLPTLGDVHHVDVIRGPGSALYGPGAIAMVINIVTETSATFEGTEVKGRAGAVESFYSAEIKHGKRLDDDSGYFLYAGVTRYHGADLDDSPYDFGRPGQANTFGWPEERDQPDLHEAWRDKLKYKFHAQYENSGFEAWVRYTNGGEFRDSLPYFPETFRTQGDGYQQLTLFTRYNHELCPAFGLEYSLSYDIFDYEKAYAYRVFSHREDEATGRVLATWKPNDNHVLAFGGEFSYERFGLESPGWPGEDPLEVTFWTYGYDQMPRWDSMMYSGLAEYQWRISEEWTAFLGGRADYHSFTDDMYSPRAALIFTPDEKDTLKLSYTRSVRTGLAADMKLSRILTGRYTDPEKIAATELRYERQHWEDFWVAASLFHHSHELTGYNYNLGYTTELGTLRSYGAELEAIYRGDTTTVIFSHGYTQLIDFQQRYGTLNIVTAEPYGYGNDLANWADHISKVIVHQEITDELSADGSLRAYWGYPGFEDFAEFVEDQYGTSRSQNRQFRPAFFLSLGLQYDFSEAFSARLDGHDLVGFFDHDLNKRLFGYDGDGDSRATAPSFSLTLTARF